MKGTKYREKKHNTVGIKGLQRVVWQARTGMIRLLRRGMRTEPGIDGILVTVGLCIIALLLCVVMKDSLQTFIETIVGAMTSEAQKILTGVAS